MKKIITSKTAQKLYIFLTLIFLLPIWICLQKGVRPVPWAAWVGFFLAVICFVLDRTFKYWELDRAERRRKRAEEQQKQMHTRQED